MLEPMPFELEDFPGERRSLRLAVVTETYPPELNGVANTAARFVEELRVLGHQVQLVRPRQSESETVRGEAGFEQFLVRGLAIPRYPDLKLGLPAKRSLERLWTFRRPDVVHVVTEGPLGWSALQAAAKLKLPVVSDFRTNFHAYSQHYGVGWLKKPILAYLRKFHNRTLCTLVPTDALRADLAATGFKRVKVIGRGVDTRKFDPSLREDALRASWGAGPGDPVVLYVGRLAAEKNLDTLVGAYKEVRQRAPSAKLVLVGDGPQRKALQKQLPEATFAGVRSGRDLARHFASGDLFLFPSLTETYGNVTLEAMASGLAVVAFNYAAAANAIAHGENGVLVSYGDSMKFVREAGEVAANLARARTMGQGAREAASGLGWDRLARELEAVLVAAAEGRVASAATAAKSPADWAQRTSSMVPSRCSTMPVQLSTQSPQLR
jgi:glycosyltransferase involved in cell wall biosynthesis